MPANSFLGLPPEIRVCIYDEIIRSRNFRSDETDWMPPKTYTNLLRTCRKVHDDASHHLYSRHTLTIPLGARPAQNTCLFKNLGAERVRLMFSKFKKIRLVADPKKDQREYLSLPEWLGLPEDLGTFTYLFAPPLVYRPQIPTSLQNIAEYACASLPTIEKYDIFGVPFKLGCIWQCQSSTVADAENVVTTAVADPVLWPSVRINLLGCENSKEPGKEVHHFFEFCTAISESHNTLYDLKIYTTTGRQQEDEPLRTIWASFEGYLPD